MKARNLNVFSPATVISCLMALFLLAPAAPVSAQSELIPDMTLRIGRVQEALLTIEDLSEANSSQNSRWSPRTMIEGMLRGTQWLDPQRAMVLGVVLSDKSQGQKMTMAALVPFSEPNDEFAAAYGAIARDDYYLVPLPPGSSGNEIAAELESTLAASAKKPMDQFITVDIAASQALGKAEASIEEMIQTARKKAEQRNSDKPEKPEALNADQAETMIRGFLEVCRQLETLSMGLDLNRQDIAFFYEFLAMADSELAGIMTEEKNLPASILGALELSGDLGMRFRTRPFQMADATRFVVKYFGKFYEMMGVDLNEAGAVVKPFTGESVGAMAIEPSGLVIEAVSCIHPEQKMSVQFLESEYIPWLLEAGAGMTRVYQEQYPDLSIAPVFVASNQTTVAGMQVVGVQCRIPIVREAGKKMEIFQIPLRMTVTDNYMLVASDDVRMAQLIERVSSLESIAQDGPLMQMTMDLTALLKAGITMTPGAKPKQPEQEMPDLGTLEYKVNQEGRRVRAVYGIKTRDVSRLAEYLSFQKNSQQSAVRPKEQDTSPANVAPSVEELSEKTGQQTPKPPGKDEPGYWTEKGGLYLAYGNVDAAARHFEKALELDSENAAGYYNLGLAYAEKEEFEKALGLLKHSLSLDPANARYLYATGWMLMQTGKRQNGLSAIEQAAQLGNSDAVYYMKHIAPRQSAENRH